MTCAETKQRISQAAHNLGFDLVGFCDARSPESLPYLQQWIANGLHGPMGFMARNTALRASLESVLPGVRSVVVVGLNYNQPRETRPDYPKIARYALGRDYHRFMRKRLAVLAQELTLIFPDVTSRAAVDSAPILERELAQRAGLGWFGKNTCLINSQRGSWFLLGCLLTTAILEPDSPAIGGCGSCKACIDACPTNAIVRLGERWAVDARRCISAATIENAGHLEHETHGWAFGCDICQEVCPFNQPREGQPLRAPQTEDPDLRQTRFWPTTAEIAEWTQNEWDIQTRGSATRRATLPMWRRNAAMALGQNAVQPDEPCERSSPAEPDSSDPT